MEKVNISTDVIPFMFSKSFENIFKEEEPSTVLAIIELYGFYLLVKRKKDKNRGKKRYALPGGSTEPIDIDNNFRNSLFNAGCKDGDIINNVIGLIKQKEYSFLQLNIMREVLEETGLLVVNLQPFGYQKTPQYNKEYIFKGSSIFHFQKGGPEELDSLEEVYRKNFKPIDTSSDSMKPLVVLSERQLIKNINNMNYSHRTIIAYYLLQKENIQKRISEQQFNFLLRTAKIKY